MVDDAATLDSVAEEFAASLRRGENPSMEEYAARYPGLAEELAELLPTIAALESAKQDMRRRSGQGILGPAPSLERVGEFRVLREIGRGGMGLVYEAEQESLGRRAALKILPRLGRLDKDSRARFQREARTAALLNHPHIVPVFGAGEEDGTPYYAMQFIEGPGLDRVIAHVAAHGPPPAALPEDQIMAHLAASRGGPNDPLPDPPDPGFLERAVLPSLNLAYYRAVARTVAQAASALEHAHGRSVLHRDVKPANLLLDRNGHVWVADFGLAKALASADATVTAGVFGTPRYIAPEQYSDQSDARTDVYGLGLTLHELLTLRPAFDQASAHALMKQVLEGDAVPISQANPHAPPGLAAIARKASARDPQDRYATAGLMAQDLERFLEGRAPLALAQRRRTRPRWTWPALVAAAALLAALFLLWRGGGQEQALPDAAPQAQDPGSEQSDVERPILPPGHGPPPGRGPGTELRPGPRRNQDNPPAPGQGRGPGNRPL